MKLNFFVNHAAVFKKIHEMHKTVHVQYCVEHLAYTAVNVNCTEPHSS